MKLDDLQNRRDYDEDRHVYKKRRIRILIILGIGIALVTAFFLSLKGMLTTEVETKLLEYATQGAEYIKTSEAGKQFMQDTWENGTFTVIKGAKKPPYFHGNAYCFVTTTDGRILGSLSEDGKDILNSYAELAFNSAGVWKDSRFYEEVVEQKGIVELIKVYTGEKYYMAFLSPSWLEEGYLISIIPYEEIQREIHSVFQMAIIIVLFAGLAVILAFTYSVLHRNRIKKQLTDLGEVDYVTGLPGPVIHKRKVKEKLAKGKGCYAYVSFCIDNYDFIYELSGKQYCDKLLSQIAHNIQERLHEGELLTRFQNDEFGMLLEFPGELALRQRIIKLFKTASELLPEENNFCSIHFLSGVCIARKGLDIKELINSAKKARENSLSGYAATIEFFHPEEKKHPKSEEIENALSQNEFLVFLQPILSLQTGVMAGAEALVRWNHKENGLLTPNVFLPILEGSGAVTKLDFYVLEEVCEYLKAWIEKEKKVVPISINLSGKHLENENFNKELMEIVECYQIPHELLEFEFSESSVYANLDCLMITLESLREQGFLIAIDKFGAGFSSLQLLKKLPIDALKIDKKLIMDLDDSEFSNQDKTIVMHILSFAKERNLTVIAEGVETQKQQSALKEQEVELLQGYYYQKPMPAEEFELLLESTIE